MKPLRRPGGLRRRVQAAALLSCALLVGGCAGAGSAGPTGSSLQGVVESVDEAAGAAVVRILGGEDVEQAGARVRVEPDDRAMLRGLRPGSAVRLRFVLSGGAYVLTDIEAVR